MLFGSIMQPLSCPSMVHLWMTKLLNCPKGFRRGSCNILAMEMLTCNILATPHPTLTPFVLPKINKNSAAINFSFTHCLGMALLNPHHLVFIQAGAWPPLGLNFPNGAERMGVVGQLHGWVEGEKDMWACGVHVLEVCCTPMTIGAT